MPELTLNFKSPGLERLNKRLCKECLVRQPTNCFKGENTICKECEDLYE